MLDKLRRDVRPQLSGVELDKIFANLAPERRGQFLRRQCAHFADGALGRHDREPDELMSVMRSLKAFHNLPDERLLLQLVGVMLAVKRILLTKAATTPVATGLVASYVPSMCVQTGVHRRAHLIDAAIAIIVVLKSPEAGA